MRVFKASGILYKVGSNIGLSYHGIDTDSIDSIIAASPEHIPVMRSYGFDDPTNILGYATLNHTDEGIRADIVFNEQSRKIYESLLQSDLGLEKNKLGFMISYKGKLNSDNHNITKGVIRCVTINSENLGGKIDKFGWEVKENG